MSIQQPTLEEEEAEEDSNKKKRGPNIYLRYKYRCRLVQRYTARQHTHTHSIPCIIVRMCAGSLYSTRFPHRVVALVLIGPCACGGFPNFIFILFLFFFSAPSQTRRYLRSYRGKREEEKEGKKGGGKKSPGMRAVFQTRQSISPHLV